MSSMAAENLKNTKQEEALLNTLIDKGLRETKPKRQGDVVIYEGLEDLTKEFTAVEINKLLKSLSTKGYLIEKSYDSAILCPRCNSLQISSRYRCPQCQSINIQKVQLVEHMICGFIDNRSKFETEEGLVCPKCKTVIGDFLSTQSKTQPDKNKAIRVIGSSFACDKCGSKFERPNVLHNCERCGSNFTYSEANYEKLPSYELTDKVEELAPRRFVMDALRRVEGLLTERGFSIDLQTKIKGKSGVEQSFDIVARKGNNVILLDASPWGNPNDLISLLGKKMDVDSNSVILLDLTGNPNLASLGKPYSITVLDGRDEKYKETLISLLEDAGKTEDDKRRSPLRWRRS